MKAALERIAQNIEVNLGGPVLIHFWGIGHDDFLYMQEFEAIIKQRTCGEIVKAVFLEQAGIANGFNTGELIQETTAQSIYGDFDPSLALTTIDLCRFSPPSLMGAIDDTAKPAFIQFMRGLFSTATAEGKLFAQLRLPSEELAQESGMTLEAYTEKWTQLVLIDYNELRLRCATAHNLVSKQSAITYTLTTGLEHVLYFSVEARPWLLDDGNGDFPAGEIYVAPVEDTVKGSFMADCVFWEGETFENVVLTFEGGTLVASEPTCILEDLKHAPGDALRFAEFGLGQNPALSTLTSNSLFDEKILGSCHIAIGANNMFGGNNQGPVHIDFVATNFELKGDC